MTRVISEDVLELLRSSRSQRTTHLACLRASPLCKQYETLEEGVERLDTWLVTSVEFDNLPLKMVVTIVLASFLIDDESTRVTSVAKLNDTWLDIVRATISPCATAKIDLKYYKNAQKVALCTLYRYMPAKYSSTILMHINPKTCIGATRHIIEQCQQMELAEQRRRVLVSKLVHSAVQNVLKGVTEEARGQRLREKKQRRRLARSSHARQEDQAQQEAWTKKSHRIVHESMQLVVHTDVDIDVDHHQSQKSSLMENLDQTLETTVATDATSNAADECVVCLDALGSKRPLFTCGHARCCLDCASTVQECPLCRREVSIIMQVFV